MKHRERLGKIGRHSFSLLARLGRYELAMLLCVAVLSGGVWGFVALADEVTEGDTQTVDESLLLALRNPADLSDPIGPGWVEEMGRDFTALGGVGVLVLITLGALGYLLLAGRWKSVV